MRKKRKNLVKEFLHDGTIAVRFGTYEHRYSET